MAERRIFANVQALRGVAALMVTIGHGSAFYLFVSGGTDLFLIAYSGVDVFFVISGFIICMTASAYAGHPWRFLIRRLGRIAPAYWVVLATSAFATQWLATGKPWIGDLPPVPTFNTITLLTLTNRFVPQAWSMSFELYFYAATAFILIAPRRWFWRLIAAAMATQAAAIAIMLLLGGDPDWTVATSGLVLEFGLGCAVARLCQIGHRRHAILALFAGLLAFTAGAVWTRHVGTLSSLPRTATFGIGAACLIHAAVALELRGLFVFPGLMQRLGDWSYSIYLWHLLVLTWLVHWLPVETFTTIPTRNLYGVACLLVVIVISAISHRLIERPANRAIASGSAQLEQRLLAEQIGQPGKPPPR